METVVIMGAGFSKNSGVPIQSEIPKLLVDYPEKDEFDRAVTKVLYQYMEYIFGYAGRREYPNLEDIFTSIDISTNSGHHLGIRYSPMHLRAIRRSLVYRLFSILEDTFSFSQEVQQFISLMSERYTGTGYVVLNWDTVLERYLKLCYPYIRVDYCNGGLVWDPEYNGEPARNTASVLKLHGSSNWLYCDNCRTLFNDMDSRISNRSKAGMQATDFTLFEEFEALPGDKKWELLNSPKCRLCGNKISSHIATFSYRKSFRANSFPTIWTKAEEVLTSAQKWIFVGYSLPDADYEFKHLLKISQLKMEHVTSKQPEIEVVLLNSDQTVKKYRQFFGKALGAIYNGGLLEYLDKQKN